MTEDRLLASPDRVQRLAELIQPDPWFERHGGAEAARRAAYNIDGIEESAVRIQPLLSRLLDETATMDGRQDALIEFAEELRHILYHIGDSGYFAYVLP